MLAFLITFFDYARFDYVTKFLFADGVHHSAYKTRKVYNREARAITATN